MAEPVYLELELEAAAILCNLKTILRARDRRLNGDAPPEIPSWGRRRLRSVLLEDGKAGAVAERDGAASPDTPLASFPDSVSEEEDGAAKEEWVLQQRGVVASFSQDNADLLKQIEEYRARLRSANETFKQLHKVRRMLLLRQGTTAPNDPRPLAALRLDLNEPPAGNDATARAMAQERHCQVQKAAEARRRRLEILRAKASCRTRHVAS